MALNRAIDPGLDRLIRIFESIGNPQLRAQLSQRMSRTALRLIRESIDTSTDCYGGKMPMRIDDGAQPLQGLRGAFTASFSADGMRIGTSKWYAIVHQRGMKIRTRQAPYLRFRLPSGKWVATEEVTIPRRQLVPSASTGGLGPVWGTALRADADAVMAEYLRSG